MKRFFAYHGAEHKAIFCFEAGDPLQAESAQRYSTLHPRCGTSFLFIVMVLSILLFSLFGWPPLPQRIAIRLILLPLVAGISYEAIWLTARSSSPLLRLFTVPGLWLQRMTTNEPDNGQLEVAPVSYTHLDVYKRQPHPGASRLPPHHAAILRGEKPIFESVGKPVWRWSDS